MRKVALLCAATVVGALGITAVASAIQGQQSLTVALQSNRAGSKQKPRSVSKLTVTTGTTIVPGEAPWAATAATVHFDKNLVFNSSKFPKCSQTQVQADDSKCPKGSKVGSGGAKSTLFAGANASGNPAPTVTAYNGANNHLYLLVVNQFPAVRAVMAGTLKPDTGKYGRKLDIPQIPGVLQNGGLPNLTISLTQFRTSVGGTFKGTPYVALKGCTGGKLSYKADIKFRDSTGAVSTASAPGSGTCRKS
jgi:hypothetical protein